VTLKVVVFPKVKLVPAAENIRIASQLITKSVPAQARVLVTWFENNFRPLPWRSQINSGDHGFLVGEGSPSLHRDPYATWISEIMLQQTQVSTVIAYFNRWMARFPNVFALAEAPEIAVLEHWAGLGYYSRARNLHATAKILVHDFAGAFPWRRQELLKLKGIGEYTAGAIASLAFNQPEPILDGNLVRVFSRLYGLNFLPKSISEKAIYCGWSRAWVESASPALVNEALMELGAMICTPKQPVCSICPLANGCLARTSGIQSSLPPAKTRKEAVDIQGYVIVATCKQKVLLYQPSKPELLAGLLTFPIFRVSNIPALESAWLNLLAKAESQAFLPSGRRVSHSITHHRIRLEVVFASVKSIGAIPDGFRWESVEGIEKVLVSSLSQKIWKVYSVAKLSKGRVGVVT
jgi:A/G-specific adenine glycosylase